MTHSRFEALTFVLGALAIVAGAFLAPGWSSQATEVAAQLLLVMVLAGALHWGRDGGFLAALIAIAVYAVMRFPLLESEGLSTSVLTMLGRRAAGYAALGIIGGEISGRIKYLLARVQSDSMIDPATGVFSARYAAAAITAGVAQWQRYHVDFSVVHLVVDRTVFTAMKARRSRQVVRQIADHIRGDIRMVDDLASDATGVFFVLLPRTDASGAAVIANRLCAGIRSVLGVHENTVSATVLSTALEPHALTGLATSLNPAPERAPRGPIAEQANSAGDPAQEPVA